MSVEYYTKSEFYKVKVRASGYLGLLKTCFLSLDTTHTHTHTHTSHTHHTHTTHHTHHTHTHTTHHTHHTHTHTHTPCHVAIVDCTHVGSATDSFVLDNTFPVARTPQTDRSEHGSFVLQHVCGCIINKPPDDPFQPFFHTIEKQSSRGHALQCLESFGTIKKKLCMDLLPCTQVITEIQS